MNKMDTSDPSLPFLLVTANVGSVFEDVSIKETFLFFFLHNKIVYKIFFSFYKKL